MSFSNRDYSQSVYVTNSGKVIDPLNFTVNDVDINDIAHALSMQCRYNGHTDIFYSVGYHCILMCWKVWTTTNDPLMALQALHHDDEEYVIGDMTRPVKNLFPGFEKLGEGIRKTCFQAFNIPYNIDWLDEMDTRICTDEATALFANSNIEVWKLPPGMDFQIGSPPISEVKRLFVYLHELLMSVRAYEDTIKTPTVEKESLDQQVHPETGDTIAIEETLTELGISTDEYNHIERLAAEFFEENPDQDNVYIVRMSEQPEQDFAKASSLPPEMGGVAPSGNQYVPEPITRDVKPADGTWAQNSTGAQREAFGRANYDLVPYEELTEAFVRVAEYGAQKYAPWNWTKGMSRASIMRSLQNHIWAYQRGQDRDEDKLNEDGSVKSKGSGLLHTDHILWNAVALAHNVHHNLEDGRRAEPQRDYKPKA